VAARKELCHCELPAIWGRALAFSPDSRLLLSCGPANDAFLWDAATGKQLHVLRGHTGAVIAAAFSPDGKRALTGGADRTARLWDAESGRELRRLEGHAGPIHSAAFLADGKRLLTTSLYDNTTRLWDAATGKELVRFEGHSAPVRSLAFPADGKCLLTSASGDKLTCLWDLQAGRELRRLEGHPVAFAADGKRIVTGAEDGKPRLWDGATGKELRRFEGHKGEVGWVAIARDGEHVVTAGADKTVRLWDATTGKEERRLKGDPAATGPVAFANDGRRVVTGGAGNTALVWDAQARKGPVVLKGHSGVVLEVTFSPDGKLVLTGSDDQTARLWDAATGKELRAFKGHVGAVFSVAFSPDGKSVLTGSRDRTARLWGAATGKELHVLRGHRSDIEAAAFTPDGKHVVTGSFDATARVWDAGTGKELCVLISFLDGTWAVVDAAGRYDASNGGDVKGLHWVVGDEPIALSQLKERYYDPGLLAKYLGFNKEALRDVAAFDSVKLYPEIVITQKDAKKPVMDVALTSRGGGIGKVAVLLNGKELTGDARPRGADAGAAKLSVQLDLSNDPRLVPGQKNKVEVLAYNAEGYLCSRGMVLEFDDPGKPPADPTRLYAVVAGVSNYKGGKLNLRYAAKDADDFATALTLAAERLFGADKVQVTALTAPAGDSRPGRAPLARALEKLKKTKPGDVIVVYLAGHGVTQGGQDGEWYYLTADAQSADLADPEVRKQVALSSAELTDLLKSAPAQKQVLVLDTCHSGAVLKALTEKRDVPGSQVRALERVKDRTGMFVLAGCAADSVSYEATRYGQGLLTYSLLLGMKGGKLREGEYVDVGELFGFAADKVPELARDIGGVQRPLIASPRGAPFDIGQLTKEDRKKLPLQQVKPVVLRSNFQDEEQLRDGLNLARRVDARLRDASASARGGRLVFVDADEFPGGVQAAGRYTINGDKVTVSVTLFEGEKKGKPFTVSGTVGKPDVLADKVAAEIEKTLTAPR
jgi:WD40 repeat protein